VLLKCTSTYPATPENTNISTIPHMRDLFGARSACPDHTMGTGRGGRGGRARATVVEKHFTLARADGAWIRLFHRPHEFAALVTETERAWAGAGQDLVRSGRRRKGLAQIPALALRRRGHQARAGLRCAHVRAIAPGDGLPTKYLELFMGRRAARDITRGTPLAWDMLGGNEP